MRILRLIALVLLGSLAIWLSMETGRPARVPLLSGEKMRAESPNFRLSLKHLDGGQVNRSTVAAALRDAKWDGEDCHFYLATTCPDTGRLMYVLNVRTVTDTQLVYAGSSDGTKLISKAYWNGFGGWTNGP